MREQLYNQDDTVSIHPHADFMYNNHRAGTQAVVYDVYYSEKCDEYIYEVELQGELGVLELIRESDLQLVRKAVA